MFVMIIRKRFYFKHLAAQRWAYLIKKDILNYHFLAHCLLLIGQLSNSHDLFRELSREKFDATSLK